MELNFEIFLLFGAILLFLSLFVSKAEIRIGIPSLLIFLILGVFVGNFVLNGDLLFSWQMPKLEVKHIIGQQIGTLALIIILFSGGLDTDKHEIKQIIVPGLILATIGVLLTAILTGIFIYYITNNWFTSISFSFANSLLVASIMSSTDSASVFALLRNKNLSLKENTGPLLELESGSNDPMAYLLIIAIMQFLNTPDINLWQILLSFFWQLGGGAIVGILCGIMSVKIINKINLSNTALYSVLLLTLAVFIFAFTYAIHANGFLAVYIAGLVIGNHKIVHKRSSLNFFDGLTWLFQIIIFLVLGLMLKIDTIIDVVAVGLVIGLFLIVVARPISVLICLLPFRKFSIRARLFTSWVGLRGAVPIIFATIPLTANLTGATQIFAIVFLVTTVSLLLQGTTIPIFAQWLKLTNPVKEIPKFKEFDFEFSDEIKSIMCEITITEDMLKNGNKLMDIPLPERTLVAIVKRDNNYFIPRGSNHLEPDDTILVITDNEELLKETYKQLGII